MFDNFPDPTSPHAVALTRMKSQMHADNRHENCLDILQGMINGILIETGKALRASNKAGGRPAAQSSIRLRSSIPGTINQFHLALDELETDIVRAQEVLARDLGELRAKNPATAPVMDIEESAARQTDTQISNTDGVVIIDEPEPSAIEIASEPPKVNQGDLQSEAKAAGSSANTQGHNAQQPIPVATALQRSKSKTGVEKQQKQEPIANETAPVNGSGDTTNEPSNSAAPHTTTAPPDTSDLSLDMIFDGMDVENGSKSVPDGLDFDSMDFTATNNGQDMHLDNNASGDLDALMFGEASGDNNNGNSDNVAALLPGLENYANADVSQDFDMNSFLANDPPNDTKKADGPSRASQDAPKADSNDELFGDLGGLAGESNFDDLLDGMDFGDGVDDATDGDLMGGNEEFDNAFFGIE